MASVDQLIVAEALRLLLTQIRNGKTLHMTLLDLGVTHKQLKKWWQRPRTLKVRPVVAAKLEMLASMADKDTSNIPTLLRMIEIKYGGKQ